MEGRVVYRALEAKLDCIFTLPRLPAPTRYAPPQVHTDRARIALVLGCGPMTLEQQPNIILIMADAPRVETLGVNSNMVYSTLRRKPRPFGLGARLYRSR